MALRDTTKFALSANLAEGSLKGQVKCRGGGIVLGLEIGKGCPEEMPALAKSSEIQTVWVWLSSRS